MLSDALAPDALTLAHIAFRCQHNAHDRNLRLFVDEATRSLFLYFASVPAVLASVEPCLVTFVTFDLSWLMSPALSSCFSLGLRCISTLSQLTRMAASAYAIKNNVWWMRNRRLPWLYYSIITHLHTAQCDFLKCSPAARLQNIRQRPSRIFCAIAVCLV